MCHLSFRFAAWSIAWLLLTAAGEPMLARAPGQNDHAPVERVLDDYIGLYRKDTLPRWKTLFLPGFTASFTNDDGSVSTRTLDGFYERQQSAFARGPVSETLDNVRIHRSGRLAHVFADFYFTSEGTTRHGQLMLLVIEEKGQFRIAALTFTYQLPGAAGR